LAKRRITLNRTHCQMESPSSGVRLHSVNTVEFGRRLREAGQVLDAMRQLAFPCTSCGLAAGAMPGGESQGRLIVGHRVSPSGLALGAPLRVKTHAAPAASKGPHDGSVAVADLIATGPRSPQPGAPHTYVTTPAFLTLWGLANKSENGACDEGNSALTHFRFAR
jgi:hypothetical protein